MKISSNWLKQFVDYKCSSDELATLLTSCGLEVEQIAEWQSMTGGLTGLFTGEVISCVQHPNADRLHVTTVDAGDGVIRQIVCGAPNVKAGIKVIVALPGAIMHPITGEPFEIKKSKIRGEVSDGMLCAEDEIGLGISHEGLLILPPTTVNGTPAASFFKVEKDVVFEIGLTPNRADAASHLGVARDVVALLAKSKPTKITMPEIKALSIGAAISPVKVIVEDVEACPRYSGLYIEDVKVGESPEWLRNRLRSIGIRPINNIVDVTNYVLHELGQPLHAFDAAKIANNTIHVKSLSAGTLFKTLDGVERKLAGHELMITDDTKGLCIAGVFGGADSGVSETTTSLFLESAYFNPVRVRKAARQHALNTDSSFRFERGTDPEMTVFALLRAAQLILETAGGSLPAAITDNYPSPILSVVIPVTYSYLSQITGIDIPVAEIHSILVNLGMKIISQNKEGISIEVPAFKVDVTRPADIAEEILRIYGYNAVELPKKLSFSQAPVDRPDPWQIENRLGSLLISRGFNEVLSNSLTSVRSSEILPPPEGEVVRILNPLSSDLGILRHTMLATGLETISYNLNRQQKNLRLFENGFTYHKFGVNYEETRHLSMLLTGMKNERSWNVTPAPFDLYYLKSIVNDLFLSAGLDVQKLKLNDSESAEGIFYTYHAGKKLLATFGKVDRKVLKHYDISQDVWYAEIRFNILLTLLSTGMITIPPPPKFPEVRRDLSMVLDKQVRYQDIEKIAFATVPDLLREVSLFDVYEGDKIEAGKKSYAMSFLLRDEEQTLQDQRIDRAIDKLMKQLEEKLGVSIRKG